MMKRWLAVCLCLMMLLPCAALGETALVPQWDAWGMAESVSPVRVTASAELSAWMPFDEDTLAALNRLISHMAVQAESMNLSGETWGKTALLLGDAEVAALISRDTDEGTLLNASFVPGQTLTAAGSDPTTLLLGEGAAFGVPGFNGTETALVQEAKRLIGELPTLLADYRTEKTVSKKISKVGTATTQATYTIGKDDASKLGEALAGAAQEERVKAFLQSLTFSKKQVLTVFTDKNGEVLRFTYEGQLGVGENTQRKVTLEWNMKDDGETARDTLTLKSPAVSGSDKDSLTWTRVVTATKAKRTLEASFTYTTVRSKVKTILEGKADLSNKFGQKDSALTGDAWIKRTDNDGDTETWLAKPDLTLALAEDAPAANGTVQFTHKENKRTVQDAKVTLTLEAGTGFNWETRSAQTDLTTLSADDLTALKNQAAENMASEVLKAMLTLPEDDLAFIREGLTEEAWQRILAALGGA